MPDYEYINRMTKDLIKRGKLMEAGWFAFRFMAVPLNAPQHQLDAMRESFLAGAQHLYGSIMGVLNEDDEPSAEDLRRMEMISRELSEFIRDYKLRHGETEGNA